MPHRLLLALLLLAAPLAAHSAPRTGPLRVLFLGHTSEHHDSGTFHPLLMRAWGREAIYLDYETSPAVLTPARLADYDAVLLYANHDRIAPEQAQALLDFVAAGGGYVPVHSASFCFRDNPEAVRLVGGQFKSHGTGVFKPVFTQPDHPILQGLREYETWDETYVHHRLTDDRDTLMERIEGDHHEPWSWTRTHGQGRIFYTASGHDERTWGNEDFQKLLRNGLRWAVGDARRATWEAFLAGRAQLQYEPHPEVANYEKRPAPLPYQHPLAAKDSADYVQAPADCRLELFAAEPDITKPLAMAWDERGRLWLAESVDYPNVVEPDHRGRDVIRICEDTNGDGRADKFTVFAEGFNIPTGLTFARGGVIVACAPDFWFLSDTNGDDRADVRIKLHDKVWGKNDTHAGPSSLGYGLDNWHYGSIGYAGFKGQVGGTAHEFRMGVYRFRADGSAIEFLHQFSNNTWGYGENAAGDVFGSTANGAPTFFGGLPERLNGRAPRGKTALPIATFRALKTITPNIRQVDVFGGFTAAAGHAFVDGPGVPPRFRGTALVTEPTGRLVASFRMERKGAGYAAYYDRNLLAGADEWFGPVAAEVGPDGSIWVADFYNFIIQHNPTPSPERGGYAARTGKGQAHENSLRDTTRGRIWRVVWNGAPPAAPRSLAGATPTDLAAALADPNPFWRRTAQRLLVERGDRSTAPALRTAVAGPGPQNLHALWTLHGLGELDDATHRNALAAPDAALRRNALRALGADAASQQRYFVAPGLHDPDPLNRLVYLERLGDFPSSPEVQLLVRNIAGDPELRKDAWLDEAVRMLIKVHQVTNAAGPAVATVAGDAARGRALFEKHPTAACINCHIVAGKGSPFGPALDGIAARKDAAYLRQSVLEPNARIADGFAFSASPMPPIGLLLTPQEIEDVLAFLGTLK